MSDKAPITIIKPNGETVSMAFSENLSVKGAIISFPELKGLDLSARVQGANENTPQQVEPAIFDSLILEPGDRVMLGARVVGGQS